MALKLTGYSSTATNINLPTSIDLAEVVSINYNTFVSKKTLIQVSGDSILNIGGGAFENCYSLTTASFPKCSYIGPYAFENCFSLTTASFPNCSYIGIQVFFGCSSLTTASFPNCSYVGDQAFIHCSSLTTASFPNCSYIGGKAFRSCSSLTSISFPKCSYIGEEVFVNTSLSDWNGIVNSYYKQSSGCLVEASTSTAVAFAPACGITNVEVSDVKKIKGGAFINCPITTVSFPNCSYVGGYGFSGCSNLTSVYLTSNTFISFQPYTFMSCTKINSGQGRIYVNDSLLSQYRTAEGWSRYSRIIVSPEHPEPPVVENEFYIYDGYTTMTYEFDEGMTWYEFVNSSYNPYSIFTCGGPYANVYYNGDQVRDNYWNYQYGNSTIEAGKTYYCN